MLQGSEIAERRKEACRHNDIRYHPSAGFLFFKHIKTLYKESSQFPESMEALQDSRTSTNVSVLCLKPAQTSFTLRPAGSPRDPFSVHHRSWYSQDAQLKKCQFMIMCFREVRKRLIASDTQFRDAL